MTTVSMEAKVASPLRSTVDPITLEIVRNGLKAIAQRITRRMIRSANSSRSVTQRLPST